MGTEKMVVRVTSRDGDLGFMTDRATLSREYPDAGQYASMAEALPVARKLAGKIGSSIGVELISSYGMLEERVVKSAEVTPREVK